MIPKLLVKDINDFYSSEYPNIGKISFDTNGKKSDKERNISFVDAFLLLLHARQISDLAVEYVEFCRDMLAKFRDIEIFYNQNANAGGDHKDAVARPAGWAGYGTLPLALVMFSHCKDGVSGNYLECGVFKGGNLACMSHVCNYVGRKAIAADTFAGLPHDDETGYWKKNQFVGPLNEVRQLLSQAGVMEPVIWKQGLFADTLPTMREEIGLVFLDTDLYDSSMSALQAIHRKLTPGAVIATDGCSGLWDFADGKFSPQQNEAKAVADFFDKTKAPYSTVWTGNGNMTLFGVPPHNFVFSTGFIHFLVNELFFHHRFDADLILPRRQDVLSLKSSAANGISELADFVSANILHQSIIGSQYMGGLEWRINNP